MGITHPPPAAESRHAQQALPWPVWCSLVDLGILRVLILLGLLMALASRWDGIWTTTSLQQVEQIENSLSDWGPLTVLAIFGLQMPLTVMLHRRGAPLRPIPRWSALCWLLGGLITGAGFCIILFDLLLNQTANETMDHYYRHRQFLSLSGMSLIFPGPLIMWVGVVWLPLDRWWRHPISG